MLHPMVQSVQSKGGQIYGQGNGPMLHTKCSIKEDNLPLLWYLGKWGNQVFCEIFRTQNLTLYTLRLVSPWGRPEHTLLPNTLHTLQGHTLLPNTLHSTQHTLQEAALQPRDFRRPPYGQETTPTVSPAYPAYPSFRQSIPMVPSVPSTTQTTRLQDCKYCQPTESIMPRRGKIQRNSPEEANTEKSLAEAA